MNGLALCAGVGGLELGLHRVVPGYRAVCYVEREAYAAAVLVARMEDSLLDSAPIWDDIKTFDGRPWCGIVDIVSGGYPCQPFSLAGRKLGTADPRHLWPDIARIVGEVRPRICFFENVAAHVRVGFEQVHDDLRAMGFSVAAGIFTAEEAGAPHQRERLFILAYAQEQRGRESDDQAGSESRHDARTASRGRSRPMGNADNSRWEGRDVCGSERSNEGAACPTSSPVADSDAASCRVERRSWLLDGVGSTHWSDADGRSRAWPPGPIGDWATYLEQWPSLEPAVRRGSDGLASRMDRLRATGNGVVPQQAALAYLTLSDALEMW